MQGEEEGGSGTDFKEKKSGPQIRTLILKRTGLRKQQLLGPTHSLILMGPKNLHFNKFPGVVDAAGPGTTL